MLPISKTIAGNIHFQHWVLVAILLIFVKLKDPISILNHFL